MVPKIDDSWYQRPKGISTNESAGGVVFRQNDGQYYVALVLEGRRHQAYILPKGRLEPGETIEEAARREIAEEAGFTELELCCKLGVRERLTLFKKTWKTTHYFLFQTSQIQVRPTDRTHIYQVDWFTIDALPNLFWPEQQDILNRGCQWLRTHENLR